MFCRNCGTQLPDGSKFCPACGTPTGFVPPAEEVKDAAAAPVEEMKDAVEQTVPVGDDAHIVPPAEEIKQVVPETPAEEIKQVVPETPTEEFNEVVEAITGSAPVAPEAPAGVSMEPSDPPQQSMAQDPQSMMPQTDAPEQPKKKKSGIVPLLIALGAVLVVVAVLACLLVPKLFGGSKNDNSTEPIDHMFNFINTGDADELFAALQPEFIDALAEEVGISTETAKKLIAESISSELSSYAEGGLKVSYEIEDSQPLDEDELNEIRYDLEYYYNIDGSKVTDGVEHSLFETLTYSGGTETDYEDYICYLYDGNWYLWID